MLMNRSFKIFLLFFFVAISSSSCYFFNGYYVRKDFKYPKPVDTKSKNIQYQIKKIYSFDNVYFDNTFDGARMNNVSKLDDSTYQVDILPENYPINDSPWYSFRVWSDSIRNIYIKLNYENGHHRYIPKISSDRTHWNVIDTSGLVIADDRSFAIFPFKVDTSKIWISAEEIINSSDVKIWMQKLKKNAFTSRFLSVGKTKLNKGIPFFRIGTGNSKGKDVIVLLSRQHPPEISGFLALKSFIEELLIENKVTEDFYKEYEFWVFPLMNPDGVDLGHWRHNANGVDLNRDWAYYRQPEVDAVTDFIVSNAKENKNEIVLSVDFHSTQKDVYYVYDDSFDTELKRFTKYWTDSIDRLIYPFESV
ncbi:MAG TPA: hypothetical protein ENK91_12200, partial [Bacteroidetes bacterium]|nr:hypothetical protein [Bacteroidota bacterium]